MEIRAMSKFEIGQTVRIKGSSTYFVINNVMAECCSGGTQILYKGVLLFEGFTYRKDGLKTVDPTMKSFGICINEEMLELIPEEKKQKDVGHA